MASIKPINFERHDIGARIKKLDAFFISLQIKSLIHLEIQPGFNTCDYRVDMQPLERKEESLQGWEDDLRNLEVWHFILVSFPNQQPHA